MISASYPIVYLNLLLCQGFGVPVVLETCVSASDTMTYNYCRQGLFKVVDLLHFPVSNQQLPPNNKHQESEHFFQSSKTVNTSSNTIIMSSTNQYDAPTGDVVDDDYKSRTGQSEIPVVGDGAKVESTEYDNGGDSDKQLGA
jgi:hypothetical protein